MYLDFDSGFKVFAATLETRLSRYAQVPRSDLLKLQMSQLKNLVLLEDRFKKTLISDSRGARVYERFVAHVLTSKSGILAARPFFRERQQLFSDQISQILKMTGSVKPLYKYRINHGFVTFALQQFKWSKKHQIIEIASKIQKQRLELLEQNVPLAISQTRMFWDATPKSHLAYMDLIQIHCMGLLIAIDKFVPPEKGLHPEEELEAYRGFRAVAIGRMMGDRIQEYSDTMLHFYPIDRRKIYRALKALRRSSKDEKPGLEEIVERVNEGIENPKQRTNRDEISQLIAGASHVSGDSALGSDGETTLQRFVDTNDVFEKIEEKQAISKITAKVNLLDLIERKTLVLKGLLSYESFV